MPGDSRYITFLIIFIITVLLITLFRAIKAPYELLIDLFIVGLALLLSGALLFYLIPRNKLIGGEIEILGVGGLLIIAFIALIIGSVNEIAAAAVGGIAGFLTRNSMGSLGPANKPDGNAELKSESNKSGVRIIKFNTEPLDTKVLIENTKVERNGVIGLFIITLAALILGSLLMYFSMGTFTKLPLNNTNLTVTYLQNSFSFEEKLIDVASLAAGGIAGFLTGNFLKQEKG